MGIRLSYLVRYLVRNWVRNLVNKLVNKFVCNRQPMIHHQASRMFE